MAKRPLTWEPEVPALVAQGCGGDVRKSINAVELLCEAAVPKDGTLLLTEADAKALSQRSAMRYDRGGDAMYDAASALHKSIRGSDPDAALHYLARLLEAGDLPSACLLYTSHCPETGSAQRPQGGWKSSPYTAFPAVRRP